MFDKSLVCGFHFAKKYTTFYKTAYLWFELSLSDFLAKNFYEYNCCSKRTLEIFSNSLTWEYTNALSLSCLWIVCQRENMFLDFCILYYRIKIPFLVKTLQLKVNLYCQPRWLSDYTWKKKLEILFNFVLIQ